jgi:hypothetical protein
MGFVRILQEIIRTHVLKIVLFAEMVFVLITKGMERLVAHRIAPHVVTVYAKVLKHLSRALVTVITILCRHQLLRCIPIRPLPRRPRQHLLCLPHLPLL